MRQTQSSVQKQSQPRNNAGGKRLPGRPRSEQARVAILRSTSRLLQRTGFAELSIEAIAAHAGVGRDGFYREFRETSTLQQPAGAPQNGHACLFTAGPSRQAFAAGVVSGLRLLLNRRLRLPHGSL